MDSGGPFMKLLELVVGLVVIGIVLSTLASALSQVMPLIVIVAAGIGLIWLVVWLIKRRRDRW